MAAVQRFLDSMSKMRICLADWKKIQPVTSFEIFGNGRALERNA